MITSIFYLCVVLSNFPGAAMVSRANRKQLPPESLPRVFESAFAIVPPDDSWSRIQLARIESRDAGLLRWPPHINILYPFIPKAHFPKVAPDLAEALKDIPPFSLTLSSFASFDRPDASVLYLVPEVTEGPVDVLEEIYRRALFVAPYCSRPGTFVPHMTISHYTSKNECDAARISLEKWWEPLTFRVDQAHLLSRLGTTKPFEHRWSAYLGTGEATAVDKPYNSMVQEDATLWAAETRRGLQDRIKRGRQRQNGIS